MSDWPDNTDNKNIRVNLDGFRAIEELSKYIKQIEFTYTKETLKFLMQDLKELNNKLFAEADPISSVPMYKYRVDQLKTKYAVKENTD